MPSALSLTEQTFSRVDKDNASRFGFGLSLIIVMGQEHDDHGECGPLPSVSEG